MSGTTRWQWTIDGALNFRDVGGLPCRAGGSTRHGVLLRSGTLRRLTEADADVLTAVLDVGTVIDLRTADELAADGPSVLARAGVATAHLPLARDGRRGLATTGTAAGAAEALQREYQTYLDERGHHIAVAARLVAGSTQATLLHGTAGTDRTGVAVAVLLEAVGVERSAVIADYTATNDVHDEIARALPATRGSAHEADPAAHRARPAVLTAVLEGLDDAYGGAAQWLRERGLTDAELAVLRHRLVRTAARRLPGEATVTELPRTRTARSAGPPIPL